MLKRTILAAAAVCAGRGHHLAQENATLVLRSGDKVTGQLVDMGGVGFTMRVSGQERNVPTNDVAIIDFTGNGDLRLATGRGLRRRSEDGPAQRQTVEGQLHDISGTTPLKITLRTSSGERELSSKEIGRIVLARPSNAVATSGSSSSTSGFLEGTGIAVSASSRWTPTGLTVRQGERITFSSTGEVQLSTDASDLANANGALGSKICVSPGA